MNYTLTKTLLKTNDVSLQYGDNLILRNINLEVKDIHRENCNQGQVICFAAPSGAGKSQLCKILAGLNKPTTGEVLIGEDLHPVKAGDVGYVTQDYFIRRNKKVRANLELAVRHLSKKEADEQIDYYVKFLDIENTLDKYPVQLSGGQRQRVAITQQLLCSSHYLIMDEPFSGLDPHTKEKTIELILNLSLKDELNTIIIVTHDIVSGMRISDTVWLLGRERDVNNKVIKGSTIRRVIDLAAQGLCWDKQIATNPKFIELVNEVENEFKYL